MIEVENIGYDATGKNIDGNQLLKVATRINRFICTIEQISTDYGLMIYIFDIIQARRMDPIFFRYGTSLFGQKYKLESIGSCIIDMQSDVGAWKSDQASAANGIVQIRPANIDKDGILVFDKNVYLPTEVNIPSLQYNDVLFNNTNNSQELVGKTAIFRGNEVYKFSNHITRIRVNQDKILPYYWWLILNIYQRKSFFYSICTN